MKIFTRFFLPIFIAWTLSVPSHAYAATPTFRLGATFYPATAAGYGTAVMDVASFLGRASPWVNLALTAGALGKLALDWKPGDGTTQPLNILPANQPQVITAPGWSCATVAGVVTCTAPSTANPTVVTKYDSGSNPQPFRYNSASDACNAGCTAGGYTNCSTNVTTAPPYPNPSTSSPGYCRGMYGGNYYNFALNQNTSSQCPAGYAVNGTGCILSNSSQVMYPSDGVPTLVPTGTGFVPDVRDPDPINTIPYTSPITINGTDATTGAPSRITIATNSDASITITTAQQTVGSDGTLTTYKQSVVVAPNGTIQSPTTTNTPGTIDQSSGATPLSPTLGTGSTIQLPTDYARQGEASAAAQSINSNINSLDAAATAKSNAMTFQAAPWDINKVGLPAQGSFQLSDPSTAIGNAMPAHTACQPFDYVVAGHHVNVDPCPFVNVMVPIMDYVIVMAGIASGLWQILGRREESA